ncbi:MAG: hypothetical protein LBK54_02875 [Propionibacteriaceae bacterium]|nr:hypothetical protein [Propionibacteriaceae bacterium]
MIALVIVVALCLGGCTRSPRDVPRPTAPASDDAAETIIGLLYDRYGEGFSCIDIRDSEGVDSVVYTMTTILYDDRTSKTSHSPEHTFTANWYPTLDRPLRDNYLSLKMAPPFRAAAQARVDALFPTNITQILLDDVWAPDDLSPDISQYDYQAWSRRKGGLTISILAPVEPGSTAEDTVARLPGLIAAAADLGVARVDVELRVYSPDNYTIVDAIVRGGNRLDVFKFTYSYVAAEAKARQSWPSN